ncbi:hypothetical protein NX773_23405, partial [Massilia solisilvae]
MRSANWFAIVPSLLRRRTKSETNQVVKLTRFTRKLTRSKNEVDDKRETLHNLTSLLLTNKTIRTMQQGS